MIHPDATTLSFDGKQPRIPETAFSPPGARADAGATMGPEACVRYNWVLGAAQLLDG